MFGVRGRKAFCGMLPWVAVLVWMALIFFLSARPYELSGADSGRVAELIVEAMESLGIRGRLNSTDTALVLFVRKAGHFIEYSVLCLLVMNALVKSRPEGRIDTITYRKLALIALVVCVSYALGDEVHQSFVPGRSMMAGDVAIDSAAAVSAVLFYMRYIAGRRNI